MTPPDRSATPSFGCDACGAAFAPPRGGICPRCRRILCERHWSAAPPGTRPVCDDCRAGAARAEAR